MYSCTPEKSLEAKKNFGRVAALGLSMDLRCFHTFDCPGMMMIRKKLIDIGAYIGGDIPHRSTLTERVEEEANAIRQTITRTLPDINFCALTADMWKSSMTNTDYLTVTCHFDHLIDDELSKKN